MPVNYYFSGMGNFKAERLDAIITKLPYRLLSCYESYTKYAHEWLTATLKNPEAKDFNTILLDSGAFTGWNQGHEVKLETLMPIYYDFMSRYWSSVREVYLINLDKIPGSPGRTPDQAEIEDCIRISDENYELLVKEFGARVLPVFHQGENEERLKECVAMSEYICVSPRNDVWEGLRVKWSREVHGKIPRTTRTHGLATTGFEMMTTVPWTSVDSATWIFKTGTGVITLCLNGKMVDITVSSKSPSRFTAGQHITNIPKVHQKIMLDRIDELGFTLEELAEDHKPRQEITVLETQYWIDNFYNLTFNEPASLFPL